MAAIPATQPHAAQLLALRAALDTLPPLPPRATLLDELLAAATAAPAVPALRSAWQARAALQPHVTQAATLRDAGCNPMWRRLQPYETRAATLCDRAATLCTWQALNESLLALPSLAAAQHSMQVYGDLQATPV